MHVRPSRRPLRGAHQIGTDFLREMALAAPAHNITLPDLELACAPLRSELGERYLGAMRAGIIRIGPGSSPYRGERQLEPNLIQ
jgi:hypothetical protein